MEYKRDIMVIRNFQYAFSNCSGLCVTVSEFQVGYLQFEGAVIVYFLHFKILYLM